MMKPVPQVPLFAEVTSDNSQGYADLAECIEKFSHQNTTAKAIEFTTQLADSDSIIELFQFNDRHFCERLYDGFFVRLHVDGDSVTRETFVDRMSQWFAWKEGVPFILKELFDIGKSVLAGVALEQLAEPASSATQKCC